ncbi:MAG: STT3 domain-containing protein, partial [Minisyncoccales bacterium]
MDNKEIKEGIKGVKNFFLDRRVQIGLIVLLMVAILALGTLIRVQNSSLLIDQTTEEYIPLALDPYYFMRISETIVETGGDLPAVDPLRNPVRATGWSPEILPDSTVGIFKVLNILGVEKGLGFAVVINPVVFFVLGALVFFFLIFYLTKSKWIALLSTFMLSIIPPYLYRTMMGFADHESIGMFAFFSALLVFAISLRIGKKKSNLTNNILLGLLLGLVTTFTIISWGGVAKFLFMIIPLGFLVYWLVHCKEKDSGNKIWFYGLWLVSVLLFNSVFGIAISETVRRYLLNAVGFFSLLVLGIIIIDYLMIKYLPRVKSKISEDYRVFFSTALTIVLGGILYQIFVGNVFH